MLNILSWLNKIIHKIFSLCQFTPVKSARFKVHTRYQKTNVEQRDSENRLLITLFTIPFFGLWITLSQLF